MASPAKQGGEDPIPSIRQQIFGGDFMCRQIAATFGEPYELMPPLKKNPTTPHSYSQKHCCSLLNKGRSFSIESSHPEFCLFVCEHYFQGGLSSYD